MVLMLRNDETNELRSPLTGCAPIAKFVLAGNAYFTVVSKKTGTRFTYRVRRAEEGDDARPWFVAVLSGPQNEADYTYLGTIFHQRGGYLRFFHGKKSRVGADAPSVKAFAWFFQVLEVACAGPVPPRAEEAMRARSLLEQVEVWHEGRCGRCGRKLTVPESVAAGLGPDCAGRIGSDGRGDNDQQQLRL